MEFINAVYNSSKLKLIGSMLADCSTNLVVVLEVNMSFTSLNGLKAFSTLLLYKRGSLGF